jgi:hypothetical protein
MHKDSSVTVRRLKEAFASGRGVIITGSNRDPEMGEAQKTTNLVKIGRCW